MPLGSSQRKLSFNTMNNTTHRHLLVERCSTLRACESCKRKKRVCNGQRPCSHCNDSKECIYSVVSDHARGVFTTSTARRLSSGSACETCRRRKTKCDGGSPCNYCATNQLECINNSERRKRSLANIHQYQQQSTINTNNSNNSTTITNNNNNNTNTQPLLSSPLSSSSSSLTTNTIKSTKNNKNNKKLQLSSSSSSSSTTTTSTTSSSSSNTLQSKELDGNEAMDRIEDRLSRIEKLMKAFSPTNTLSQTSSYQDMLLHQSYSTNTSSSALRKMSSPVHATFQKHQSIRPHRHSVQGITVAKEKAELRAAFHMSNSNSNSNSLSPSSLANQYPTPPNSKSSSNQLLSTSSSLSTLSSSTSSSSSTANTNNTTTTTTTTTTTLPPPLPPSISNNNSNNNNNNNNNASHKLTHSMLNLTLSPSSSTSSTTNNIIINNNNNNNTMISPSLPPPPHSPPHYYTNDILNRSPSPEGDWKSPIPSLMDQLSQRTFHSNAMEYTVHYPIYPLTPPPPHSHDH
ncbi:unnamed protein product [Cunninghamella echinulata]